MMARHKSRAHGRQRRQTRKRLLIIVEGQKGKSEHTYFQILQQHLRSQKTIADIKVVGAGGEPKKALRECIRRLTDDSCFDFACLVIDHDNHGALDETIFEAKRKRVIKKCPGNKKKKEEEKYIPIYVVVTNPQFELWLLWHLRDQTAHIAPRELRRIVTESRIVTDRNEKCLSSKFPIHNVEDAISRANHASVKPAVWEKGENPYSGIPWLINLIKTGAVKES